MLFVKKRDDPVITTALKDIAQYVLPGSEISANGRARHVQRLYPNVTLYQEQDTVALDGLQSWTAPGESSALIATSISNLSP